MMVLLIWGMIQGCDVLTYFHSNGAMFGAIYYLLCVKNDLDQSKRCFRTTSFDLGDDHDNPGMCPHYFIVLTLSNFNYSTQL
jgi:hypothetical protein